MYPSYPMLFIHSIALGQFSSLHPSKCNSSISKMFIHPMHSIHWPIALHQFQCPPFTQSVPQPSSALQSPIYGTWWVWERYREHVVCALCIFLFGGFENRKPKKSGVFFLMLDSTKKINWNCQIVISGLGKWVAQQYVMTLKYFIFFHLTKFG
jgi:hypothetical protein